MVGKDDRLRVALVAGTLAKGGAETQLVLMAKALVEADVDVRVYSATRGEFYEPRLQEIGCEPIWYGRLKNPLSRLASLTQRLREFRPHVIQSGHFYTNLYVALAGRMLGTLAFGCLRSDVFYEVEANGRWGPWLLKLPKALIANSESAKQNVAQYSVDPQRVFVLPNVIDLERFDCAVGSCDRPVDSVLAAPGQAVAITVCRMIQTKRLDRFLNALQLANQRTNVIGVFVGDGPERENTEKRAGELGLMPHSVRFVGWSDEIPAQLQQSDMLVICSDHEGFPNVLLESMAAAIPAIGTPAGDVARVIDDNVTGFLVPFDDAGSMAEKLVQLANEPDRRHEMGAAARKRVETEFSAKALTPRLMEIYRSAMNAQGRTSLEPLLSVS